MTLDAACTFHPAEYTDLLEEGDNARDNSRKGHGVVRDADCDCGAGCGFYCDHDTDDHSSRRMALSFVVGG